MKLTINKKIVSVSFLMLAIFMLLAVSYAYFTAQVEGNDQAKKTTVKTGKKSLKLTGPIEITAEHLVPGDSVSISFQIENTGNIPAVYNLDMIEVLNEFEPKSDLVYTVESTNNGGHVKDKEAPSQNATLIRNILIEPTDIQEYKLTLLFKDTKINQNTNQDKSFEGKVQINSLEDKTIATTIVHNNLLQIEAPDFTKPSPDINGIDHGKGMFTTEDDDGTSYYFRGDIDNNNVHFADMDWKILRINGDGSIRLILNKIDAIGKIYYNGNYRGPKHVGYTYNNVNNCTNENPCISDYIDGDFTNEFGGTASNAKVALENWYKENLIGVNGEIVLATFCNDSSIASFGNEYYFSPKERVESSSLSLKCPNPTELDSTDTHNYGGVYKLKIGLAAIDELIFAGLNGRTLNNYLTDLLGDIGWWTMSPVHSVNASGDSGLAGLYFVYNLGIRWSYDYSNYLVPVINLKSDVTFSGTGTEADPYTISS